MQCGWVWAQHWEPASQAHLQGHAPEAYAVEGGTGSSPRGVTGVQESEMALDEYSLAQATVGGGSEP